MMKFQFGPLICENYSLVPKLWKNCWLVPGALSEILDRIKDELWEKFRYSYEFMTISTWSSNLTKLQFDPWKFDKIPEWSLEHNLRFWTELRMNYEHNSSIVMNFMTFLVLLSNFTPKNMIKFLNWFLAVILAFSNWFDE
jgi:hypothetical protein